MALNFPSNQPNGTVWTDPSGEQWIYNSAENSWTSKGLVNDSGGLTYKGGLNITAAPPAAVSGEFWSVEVGGTAAGGFGPGITGNIGAGSLVLYDGAGWELINVDPTWNRIEGKIEPVTATDVIHGESGMTVGPNDEIQLDADGAATFAGNVQLGSNPDAGGNEGALIRKNGRIQLASNQGSTLLWSGYAVGTSTATSQIKADGSATFANQIISGTTTQRGSFKSFSTGNSGSRCLLIQNPTSGLNYVSMNGDGSAEFAGTVKIGGTLPSSPNINLVADGSADFAGRVDAPRFLGVGPTATDKVWSGYLTNTNNAATSFINADGSATFGGVLTVSHAVRSNRTTGTQSCFSARLNNTENALITADGVATFAGQVSSSSVIQTSRFGTNVQLGASSIDAFRIGSDATGTIKLKYDGSATFAGQVYSSGFLADTPSTDTSIVFRGKNPSGTATTTIKADGSSTFGINGSTNGRINLRPGSVLDTSFTIASGSAGGDIFTLQNDGSIYANSSGNAGALPKYKLTGSDGSATFAGTVIAGGNSQGGANDGVKIFASGELDVSRTSPTGAVFKGFTTGNSASTSRINADGSATFSSNVQVAGDEAYVNVSRTNQASTAALFIGKADGVQKFKVSYDGSADFAGNVTAANIGAFKSSLTAAATSATTLAELKTAIINALADL